MGIPPRALGGDTVAAMSATAIYAAEDQWSALLDRGGVVDFFGSRLDVPIQRRFADLPSLQRYADLVLELDPIRRQYPQAGPVAVRDRRGHTRAHYEPATQVIAIPLQSRELTRESVVLHELAHHLSCSAGLPAVRGGRRWHGHEFQSAMLGLATHVLGDAAALLLRAGYDAAGVGRARPGGGRVPG